MVTRNTDTGRELTMMRWGMPPPPPFWLGQEVTVVHVKSYHGKATAIKLNQQS
jgi:hypothetical protein